VVTKSLRFAILFDPKVPDKLVLCEWKSIALNRGAQVLSNSI
jgi:hypothetical protein